MKEKKRKKGNYKKDQRGGGTAFQVEHTYLSIQMVVFFSQLQVKELLFLSGVGASKHSVPRSTP